MAMHASSAWSTRPSLGSTSGQSRASVSVLRRRVDPRWTRKLTWALAAIWLLDAVLQFQPYMFTRAFPHEIIAPTADGNPGWVHGPVLWASSLMAHHIVLLNAAFALVQLFIAIGLFWSRTVKLALAGSVVWSLMVWWLGEGLGGIFAGSVSPLAGLPGAVVLYALIAILLWPRPEAGADVASASSVATRSVLRRPGACGVWVVLWLGFAVEALQGANRAPGALHDLVAGAADGEPGWMGHVNRAAAQLLAGRGLGFSIALAVCFALIALSVLVPALTRTGVVLAIVISLGIWVVAQDFGGILTGQGTDPNSGLPLALLALCYWPRAARTTAKREAATG